MLDNDTCYNCQERELLCHSKCEKYKQYRQMLDKIIKKKSEENNYIGHVVGARQRFGNWYY